MPDVPPTPQNQPLDQMEVINTCLSEINDSRTFTSEIQQDRMDALKGYNQEKYGDEMEGQSQYVASDIRDTIEAILPDLVEPLIGGDAPVEFTPVSDQDVDAAEAETDAVRHVYLQQNDGFMNTYSAVKDALLSKNPYWYVGFETDYSYSNEEYHGLSEMQLVMLSEEQDIEIRQVGKTDMPGVDPMGQPINIPSYDVLVRRKRDASQVCIYSLPPERVLVNRHHASVSLQDARFVCYEELAVAGDLIAQGYSQELVDQIPDYSWYARREEIVRWRKEGGRGSDNPGLDPSRRVVQILNCYIRIDEDGDGIPELRLIRIGSESGRVVLEDKEIDSIPIVSGAVIINTHKHYAVAIADLLQDVQQIRTSIMRQGLNNTYFTNFPFTWIEEGAATENTYQDILSRRPAGFGRVRSLAGIRTDAPAPYLQNSMGMLEIVDTIRSDRTGYSRESQGLDPKMLGDVTNLNGAIFLSRAQSKTKMMLRVFAETGFKNLMLGIHELLMKHGSPFPVKRNGVFQNINPREWKKREHMTVKVGTGYASRAEKMATAEAVLAKQQLVVTNGGMGKLVSEESIYDALVDWCKAANVPVSKYFTDPSKIPPPPPPPPTPEENAIQIANKEADVKAMSAAVDAKLKAEKQAQDFALKARELELKYGGKAPNVEDVNAQADAESSEGTDSGRANPAGDAG